MNHTVNEIISYLRASSPRERCVGLMLVGKQRVSPALGLAVQALSDDNDEVRAMAAWALDMLSSPVTVPALVEALYDPVFGVRSNAGWALVHLSHRMIPEMVVPDLIDVLRDHRNQDARQMAYLTLHHIGGELAHEAIQRYWRENNTQE